MLRAGILFAGLLCCTSLFADKYNLTDAFIYIDGVSYQLGVANAPGNVDLSGFSPTSFGSPVAPYTGLGTIKITFTGAGTHNVVVYYDHDINNLDNGAFNEYAKTNGSLPSGFSWQLGDPNDFSADPTDIFAQAASGNLLNRNDVGTPAPPPGICCDVAMAEGITFTTMDASDSAVLTFKTSSTAPTSGFYLSQFDVPGLTDSTPDLTPGDAVYLQGTLDVSSGTTPPSVPEPSSIVLLLSVLGGIGFTRARRRA